MKLRLLLFSAAAAQAALVAVDQVFYFELSQCPTNFAVLDAENNGLLFLGDGAVTSTAGFTNNKPLFSPGTDPVHTHIGTNNVKVTFPSLETLNGGLGGSLKDGTYGLTSNGITSESGSGFPFVQLLACKVTNANNMQVPLGLVTMMNPKTTTAAAINTCGSDFVDFTQANGRFIIPTGTTQPGPNFATANPTPAYSPTVMDIASHTHTLSSTFSIAGGDMCGGVGSTITFLLPGTYTITGPSSSSNLGLPYRVTKMCKSNVDLTDSSAPQLPEGALAYFATAACPAQNWTPADSKYTGRLIVSLPLNGINGQTFGSDTLLEVGSTGSAHLHSTWSGGEITLNSGPSVSEQAPRCADNVPIKRSVGVGSAASTLVAIPTVTVKLCRKTDESFTGQPTVPPTLTPTKTPTMPPTTTPTVPPTSVPTKTPTTMPTVTPTAAPATTPASTLAPNTQSTLLPTKPPTSAPTPAPGGTPITSAPTRVPNPAPAGVPPTVRTPTTSSPIPDGEAAAQTEDQVATIVGATLGGIAFILAAALFIRRGSFNQHAKPRHLASKASKNKDVFAMTTAGVAIVDDKSGNSALSQAKAQAEMRVPLRTIYPFRGDGLEELDVKAGIPLTGIGRNQDWWVALDESTGQIGFIPSAYVVEVDNLV